MAAPTRARKDKVVTNRGIYRDILANVMDVLTRGFSQDETLRAYMPKEWIDQDPKKVNLSDCPAAFVWINGSTVQSETVGNLSGRSTHKHRNYYVNIMFVLSEIENAESDSHLFEVASALEEVLDTNLDLNGLMNGPSERVETSFFPTPLLFQDQWKMISNIEFKMVYGKTSKQKSASREYTGR